MATVPSRQYQGDGTAALRLRYRQEVEPIPVRTSIERFVAGSQSLQTSDVRPVNGSSLSSWVGRVRLRLRLTVDKILPQVLVKSEPAQGHSLLRTRLGLWLGSAGTLGLPSHLH